MYHLHATSPRFRTETPRKTQAYLKKNKYSKAPPDELTLIQALTKQHLWVYVFKKSRTKLKKI